MPWRYEVEWAVPGGGAGVSRFHAAGVGVTSGDQQTWVDAIRAMFAAMDDQIPPGVTLNFPGEVLSVDTTSGDVTDSDPVTAPASVTGAHFVDAFSGGSGAVIRWNTSEFANGRRVRGRTFIVPLGRNAYDSSGSLQTDTITQMQAAADGYLAAAAATELHPVVFRTPKAGPPAVAGATWEITSALVPDLAAVLRSRRD